MKRTMFLVALTLAFAAASAQNLTVGSYNIRNATRATPAKATAGRSVAP